MSVPQDMAAEIVALQRERRAALLDKFRKGKASRADIAELRGDPEAVKFLPPDPQRPPADAPSGQEAVADLVVLPPPPCSHAEPAAHAQRAAWLLRRRAHGRATADEIRELAALFPPSPSLVGHLTRASYRKPLIEYARALGYKADATLKRWIDDGRAANPPQVPPFDDFSKLAEWWAVVKRRKVPDELLAVAGPAAPPATGPAATPSSSTATAGAQGFSAGAMVSGGGFAGALARARENEQMAAEALNAARLKGEPGATKMAQESWSKAFHALQRAEVEAAGILTSQGEMVRWADVDAEVEKKLTVLNQSLRSVMTRVATKVTVPPDLLHRLNRAFQLELDRVFGVLDEQNFEKPVEHFALAAA